jgi:hypothetical protein
MVEKRLNLHFSLSLFITSVYITILDGYIPLTESGMANLWHQLKLVWYGHSGFF